MAFGMLQQRPGERHRIPGSIFGFGLVEGFTKGPTSIPHPEHSHPLNCPKLECWENWECLLHAGGPGIHGLAFPPVLVLSAFKVYAWLWRRLLKRISLIAPIRLSLDLTVYANPPSAVAM